MAGAGAIKAGEAFIQIGAKVDIDKDLKNAQNKLNKFGDKMLQSSRKFAMASAAILAPLALAVRASTRFGTGMANISTMLDKTSMDMLPRFSTGLQELAVNYGEATDTLQKGLYDILSASVDSSMALNVLEASAKAARAGMSDTGTAADALTTILNSYKMEATKASDVSDWFFSVIKRGKTTFAELGPSIGMVASDAAQAGLSLEEMGAALATMTRSGIRTEQAVTRLRSIINAFLSPEKEAQKAALKLGIELNSNTLKTIGLRGVLQQLQGARIEDIANVFRETRALSGMNAMISGTTGFLKDYDLLLNRAGATEEAFAKQTETLSFQFGQLKASVKVLGETVGAQLAPTIQKATEIITALTNKLREFAKESPRASKGAGALGVGLGAIGTALLASWAGAKVYGFLKTNISGISKAVTKLIPKMKALGVLALRYGKHMGAMTGGGIASGLGLGIAAALPTIPAFIALAKFRRASEQLVQAQLRLNDMRERVALRRIEKRKNAEIDAARAVAAARTTALDAIIQKQKAAGILTGIAKGGEASFQFSSRRDVAGLTGVAMNIKGPKEELVLRKAQVDKLKEEIANRHKLMVLLNQRPTAKDRKELERHNQNLVRDMKDLAVASKRYLDMVKAIETHLPGIKKKFPGLFPDAEEPQRRQVSFGLENINALSGATTAQLNRPGQGRMKMQGATESTQKRIAEGIQILVERGRGFINGIPTEQMVAN